MEFSNTIPVLRSFDEEKAREFYIDYLGFEVEFEHRFEPGLPLYMGVTRSGCKLHVSEHHGDATPGSTVRIGVSDIDAYHRELRGKEYRNLRPNVEEMSWGTRDMLVVDPFGNRLVFTDQVAD